MSRGREIDFDECKTKSSNVFVNPYFLTRQNS